jgi:hypothetical protein
MVRWVFQRENETLTCEIDVTASNRYDVCVVPHWNVGASVIEQFDAPLSALWRHADIARRLRDTGWTVVDYASRAVPDQSAA